MDARLYNLPDFSIFNSQKKIDYSVWQPDKTYIVIGRANKIEDSVYSETARKNHIEILKRPSGGETVLLSPKTLVISVKIEIGNTVNAHQFFKIINRQIIAALEELEILDLKMKGISDISIGNKKILGSSVYRKLNTVFYHAVLNVSESAEQMETYLKHPKREPDYRKGRSHAEFVTSLKNANEHIHTNTIIKVLKNKLDHLSI